MFCRTPIDTEPDTTGLLDYLATHLPWARVRHGLFGRGPVRALALDVGGRHFRGRLRKGQLVLEPDAVPTEWCESLLAALRLEAAADHDMRRQLARSGWDFSPR